MSKPIKFETNTSGKVIGDILCQEDKEMNWHFVTYYSRKMLLTKQNYETYNAELLAIVKDFKTWRHYFKKGVYTILVFMDHNNLKKFIKITCLSGY